MQLKNVTQLVVLAVLLTCFNIYSLLGNPPFSYRNFNALMILKDGGYLYYIAFFTVPVFSLLVGVRMFIKFLSRQELVMQTYASATNKIIVNILYIYVATNFILLTVLSAKDLLTY